MESAQHVAWTHRLYQYSSFHAGWAEPGVEFERWPCAALGYCDRGATEWFYLHVRAGSDDGSTFVGDRALVFAGWQTAGSWSGKWLDSTARQHDRRKQAHAVWASGHCGEPR